MNNPNHLGLCVGDALVNGLPGWLDDSSIMADAIASAFEDCSEFDRRFHDFGYKHLKSKAEEMAESIRMEISIQVAAETAALKARAEKAEACQSAWRKWAIETVGRRGQIHCGQGIFDLAHMALINGMLNDADKSEEFANRFPKTKDGVRVFPGMECWHVDREGYAHCYTADGFDFYQGRMLIVSRSCLFSFSGDSVYSARSAAIAAKESK